METGVGVLCTRVRMEEKWVIEALARAGVPVRPLPPCPFPLPIPSGPSAAPAADGDAAALPGLVLDRLADRAVAGAIVPVLRALGATVLDAGLAASGDRLVIATALAAAGLPRPQALLVASEDAGLAAVAALGCPATMLPLDPGAAGIAFLDRDIAECVLEHREVLGGSTRALALIQAGTALERTEIAVVNGRVAGASQTGAAPELGLAVELAEAAARALGAPVLGVTIANAAGGPVVWDVDPVPAFRAATALGERSVAEAVSDLLLQSLAGVTEIVGLGGHAGELLFASMRREVGDDVVLSA